MGLLCHTHSGHNRDTRFKVRVLMIKLLNWVAGTVNRIAYIWLIRSEAFTEVLCFTMGGLVRYFLPAITRQNRHLSRLEPRMHPDNKPSILVSH